MGYYEDRDEEPEIGSPEFWQAQAELPLRERGDMWWYGVAIPNAILAAVVTMFAVLAVLSVLQVVS